VSFLAPGYLWLLGLAAPVVLLYFFRQRQEERVVPTNFLWVQALQDTRTAAVFRRFLKSLLLLLQLLFLALAVLALAGATASLWSQGSARLVVAVLDRSASMGVKDGGEGRTRLDAAKAALGNAVDGLREGDRMMLIAVDERAEVLVPFTGEKERLLAAAAKVEVRDLGTDLGDAAVLLKSQGEAAAGRDLEVLVLSDGAFPDPGGLPGAKVSYVPFGEAKDNAGVADLRIVRGPAGAASLFVSVETFGGKDLKRTLSLHAGPDLKLVDAREAAAAPLGQAVVFFPLDSLEPGPLEVRLDGEDAFAADDRAWCVYRPDPPRRYAVYGAESRWLREPGTFRGGLEGSPLPVKDAAALRAAGPLDLVIYNGEVPEDPPPSRAAIYIHCVPPKGPAKVVGTMEYPPVLDWSRTHAVTRHAEFSDLLVVEALRLEGVPPGSVLVDSPKGPLLAFLESPDQQALVLTFDLDKSNLLRAAPRGRGGVRADGFPHRAGRAEGGDDGGDAPRGADREGGGRGGRPRGPPRHLPGRALPPPDAGRPVGRGRLAPPPRGIRHRSTGARRDGGHRPRGEARGGARERPPPGPAPPARAGHPAPRVDALGEEEMT
jgi:hypothetical protein